MSFDPSWRIGEMETTRMRNDHAYRERKAENDLFVELQQKKTGCISVGSRESTTPRAAYVGAFAIEILLPARGYFILFMLGVIRYAVA